MKYQPVKNSKLRFRGSAIHSRPSAETADKIYVPMVPFVIYTNIMDRRAVTVSDTDVFNTIS